MFQVLKEKKNKQSMGSYSSLCPIKNMTIIIPYLNNMIDLAVLLVQLQQQTVKPNCIYIADNSSDESGLAIAKRYHFDKSIRIAIEPKAGTIHESWNKGIVYAGTDDVCILNDDIMVPQDFVFVMEQYMRHKHPQDTNVMMYCPHNDGFPPTLTPRQGYQWFPGSELSHRYLYQQEYVLPPSLRGWCMAIPRSTINEIGLFDESLTLYFGDKDYEARIFSAGGAICFVKGLFVQHFGSSSTRRMISTEVGSLYAHDEAVYKTKYNINENTK